MPLKMTQPVMANAFAETTLMARMQHCRYGGKDFVFDVAHNEAGAAVLAPALAEKPQATIAIFAALKDKDSQKMVNQIKPWVSHWLLLPLNVARATDAKDLQRCVKTLTHTLCTSANDAINQAMKMAQTRVLVFGSFHTVAQCLGVIHGQ